MSFLKQILSPFVEFKEDPNKQPVREYTPPPEPVPVPVYPAAPPSPAAHPLVTGLDEPVQPPAPLTKSAPLLTALPEHTQYFEHLIEEANAKNPLFAGNDFKEFVDSKMNIDDIADEETKYKTAFNVFKRSGVTKEKLLSTAQEYLNVIGRDLNAFQGAHMQRYLKETREREQVLQKKAEEVMALSDKLNALKKEISQLSQEMNDTREKMDRTKNSFLLAGEHKQQEIQTEMQKIQRYF